MTLLDAIRAGDPFAAMKALKTGADANELGANGETPLMAAASAGWVDLVKALLDRGAETSLTDATGETARAAKLLGDENPSDRVDRVIRAEKHRKK